MKWPTVKVAAFLVGGVLFGSHTAWAAEQKVSVNLSAIEIITATENQGDELYFSVTEYSSIDKPRSYLVPEFPTHWLSKFLSKVTGVPLWNKTLKDNEAVTVIFSLIERDAPPWNVDDLIGTVKLKVQNEKGKIHKTWSIPNRENTEPLEDRQTAFKLTGDEGEYHIALQFKQKN